MTGCAAAFLQNVGNIVRCQALISPEHHQVIEKIRRFRRELFPVSLQCFDTGLNSFLSTFCAIFAVPFAYREAV